MSLRVAAINPQFEANREKIGEENGVTAWGSVDLPEKHGIHGTYVAVDFDICLADGACPEDCPVDVFMRVDTPGHPRSDIKAEPTHEDQCIDCTLCVGVCLVNVINIDPG